MNISDIFTSRDKNFVKLTLAQDYLSRLVRENMTVFNYDGTKHRVTFLTESEALLSCNIKFAEEGATLTHFNVGNVQDILSDERVDELVSEEVGSFLNNIIHDNFGTADENLNNIFESFKARSEIAKTRTSLSKKMERFGESHRITNLESFDKINEMKGALVEFIKENKEGLTESADIVNSSKLASLLGIAFDADKIEISKLQEEKSIFVDYNTNKSVYELVCQQELISSELVESKENFSKTWINNEAIHKLSSCLYSDDATISSVLEETIKEVPYLALASKASIKEILTLVYESSKQENITKKEIKAFTSKIFEMKKPVKAAVIETLNTKHGINVQNLKFIPSFTNLAKAQSVFFEALASFAGKKAPALRDTLKEFAKAIHKKTGIQTLDVNDYINEVLKDSDLFSSEGITSISLAEVVASKAEKVERDLGDDSDGQEVGGEADAEANDEQAAEDAVESDVAAEEDAAEEEVEGEEGEAEEEVAQEEVAGVSDAEMKNLIGELDDLFKEVDWNALESDSEGESESDNKTSTPEEDVEA
jgi:ribosomal protein L23